MRTIIAMLSLLLLFGCQPNTLETMTLLDEDVRAVHISESKGFGGMNEEMIQSFTDREELDIWIHAITSAKKQIGSEDVSKADYDVMVEYDSREGKLPTHGLHLWLGEEGEPSQWMYIGNDKVYLTSSKVIEKLRGIILTD